MCEMYKIFCKIQTEKCKKTPESKKNDKKKSCITKNS